MPAMVRRTATAVARESGRARGGAAVGASGLRLERNNAVWRSRSCHILGETRRTWRGVVCIPCSHVLTFGASDALKFLLVVKRPSFPARRLLGGGGAKN